MRATTHNQLGRTLPRRSTSPAAVRGVSHDTVGDQRLDLVVDQAELGQDRAGVLAQRGHRVHPRLGGR